MEDEAEDPEEELPELEAVEDEAVEVVDSEEDPDSLG
jgi:hypothetical protein